MAIQLTEGEIYTLNVLNVTIQNAQAELGRLRIAKESQMVLLENKYNAQFNPVTGQLEPKREEKKPKE